MFLTILPPRERLRERSKRQALNLLDQLVSFGAGVGDTLTFGLTYLGHQGINYALDTPDLIDYDGTAYYAGEWAGTAVDFVLGGGPAAVKSLGKAGLKQGSKILSKTLAKNNGDDIAKVVGRETAEQTGRLVDNVIGEVGSRGDDFLDKRRLLDEVIELQSTQNTCVITCLNNHLPNRASTVIDNYLLRRDGLNPINAVLFIGENLLAAGKKVSRGSLDDALKSGQEFFTFLKSKTGSHAVLVDGFQEIDGVKFLKIKDPEVGVYLENIDWIKQQLANNHFDLSSIAIWGR